MSNMNKILSQREKDKIWSRIKTKALLSDPPKSVYITSDGTQFNEAYKEQAFQWEYRLIERERLIEYFKQKPVPDWMFFMIHPENLNPKTLEQISFQKAYVIEIPENKREMSEACAEADSCVVAEMIAFLHPLLLQDNLGAKDPSKFKVLADIARYKPGKYVIVYWTDNHRNVDPMMAENAKMVPTTEIVEKLKKMLNEFEQFL